MKTREEQIDYFRDSMMSTGREGMVDLLATYLKNSSYVVKINGQLHIYQDGIYINGYKPIETAMIQQIPNLRKTQRREVLC